ncbi:YjjG family noncanonical pyrimidine nucleotidase [Fluviicola taffensis]|uniref:HAD superfamily (Subfamily IA) hydrolase, TIGR02254 n=1 Tax=Fluviicola taffensis (strain DSM 16823 / NCIMB 13979 / RW262) TaxID=755732 RepID=F2IAS0_FLUTR|nr:YjjG family noncanonical pyrimidine nucleotidase [Fluviicola taffensis]AEA44225.1 HAD superfamily (subfamily IA) hydrolase, TIGR02254 [Fluviicola taffensis DSM 16823]
MKIRQLFFDLDRTLWDFETNSRFALQQLYDDLKLGDTIDHFRHFHHTYIKINADLWQKYGNGKLTKEELRDNRFKQTLAHHGINNNELAQQMSDGYIELSPQQTNLFPGAVEMLESLREQDYSLHIITNGFKEVQHIKLAKSGISQFFKTVLCSEEIGVTKPHREIFQEAQRLTSCKREHAIMIGDDFKADIIGALNAGWTAIHFDPEHRYKKERNVPRIRELLEIPEVVNLLPIVGN